MTAKSIGLISHQPNRQSGEQLITPLDRDKTHIFLVIGLVRNFYNSYFLKINWCTGTFEMITPCELNAVGHDLTTKVELNYQNYHQTLECGSVNLHRSFYQVPNIIVCENLSRRWLSMSNSRPFSVYSHVEYSFAPANINTINLHSLQALVLLVKHYFFTPWLWAEWGKLFVFLKDHIKVTTRHLAGLQRCCAAVQRTLSWGGVRPGASRERWSDPRETWGWWSDTAAPACPPSSPRTRAPCRAGVAPGGMNREDEIEKK